MLVRTADTFVFTVPDAVVDRCGTLRLAAAADDGGEATSEVPLPNVSSASVARVVQFYMRLAEFERLHNAPEDGQQATDPQWAERAEVRAWVAEFFEGMPHLELYRLMEAANYLDAVALLDEATAYVAALIKGKTPAEIRDIFLLPRDMTDEETRHARAELAWAIK